MKILTATLRSARPACAHPLRTAARVVRAGFTLIELMAVILILGLLAVALLPMVTDAIDTAEVTSCQKNLSNIHGGMIMYKQKFKRAPNKSGVAFFGELITLGAMENTKTNVGRLSCPAIDKGVLGPANMGLPETEWYRDLEQIDGSWSAYAGRDCREFPLRKFPGKGNEPLVADDNDPSMNHSTTTNVLYADGSVQTYELEIVRSEGLIGPEEDVLLVGPDSPIEDLRKLSLD
jgi:prepilin-type N-terminal cleavage/methylation domain-containing protein/prepilin-type processing-associated H-X9-DG protein